jgi:hypothetical protein
MRRLINQKTFGAHIPRSSHSCDSIITQLSLCWKKE